ncbi:unnamed protein product [Microthlaspi erraticum]|uniref:AAA+ ATPase domain-containing protein n=1 Tax=Microthlaspi erraticum TaxID=1685480 RepID=A0A6D2KWT8_9BRAS|nr:unnamed protein product [Microthlaspi erraticum]
MVFSGDLSSRGSAYFSNYVSMTGIMMMNSTMNSTMHSMIHNLYRIIPTKVVPYIKSMIGASTLTLVISDKIGTDRNGMFRYNELYSAFETYLSSKINPDASSLRMTKDPNNKKVNLYLSPGEVVSEIYQGIKIEWSYVASVKKKTTVEDGVQYEDKFNSESFHLTFYKKHKDLVINSFVPYVESKAKVIMDESRILKMHSYAPSYGGWEPMNFEHPSTFDTMAMNSDLKRSVIEDLDRFIRRKDFYKRVGKAWKRGYLLYGPPGTGKTSLVAAMANYLKFDIYDLQLASVKGDADLRRLLLTVKNSSILLVEDIDCSVNLRTESTPVLRPAIATRSGAVPKVPSTPLTLSGLLNCIDGLWSTCGNERIIIFTTNHKDKLDPALLRPGRMDMHIYMGHCGFEGFKILASNYLGLSQGEDDPHCLYPEIKNLIDGEVLTPAQVAEELMKTEDVDAALEGLVGVLKRKRSEPESRDDDDESMKKKKTTEE